MPEENQVQIQNNSTSVPSEDITSVFSSGPEPKPLNTDLFTPTGDGGEPKPQTPAEPKSEPDPTKVPAPTPAQAQLQNPPPPQPGATDALADVLKNLDGTLKGIKTTSNAPPSPPDYEKVPDYGYNIPDEIMNALASEDPGARRTGLAAIATGVSRNVHQSVMRSVNALISQSIMPTFTQRMQESLAAQEVFRDFYGTHKDLAKPELQPVVRAVAERLVKPGIPWSADVGNMIAGEVRKLLGIQIQALPQTPPPPQNLPPVMIGGGARGGAGGRRAALDPQDARDILEME